ncbi:hypothetical protein, partial [Streptomyces sp. NPDC048312]|uniref:hypothetical protein n=1 Tax=Streptomyces sp. NPDC048312 TaxID=3155485 RepID=UPI0033E06C6D
FMAAGGNAILDNMALLFAVGIAIGFAKKSDARGLLRRRDAVPLRGTFPECFALRVAEPLRGSGSWSALRANHDDPPGRITTSRSAPGSWPATRGGWLQGGASCCSLRN